MQYCLGTVAPTLDIIITHGSPFIAGQSYNLTCTITLENATGTPTVEWLDPTYRPLPNSSDITVGTTVTVHCSTYTTILHFTTLRTSHSGQYSCQATLGGVNNTAAVNITVPSKSILSFYAVVIVVSLCFCLFFFFFFHFYVVPPPIVTVTIDQNSNIKSAGANFTLTCITELPPEVHTNITVNINWTGPAGDVLASSSNSPPMAGIPTRSQNILIVTPVNVDQFGNYSCTATVNSDPPSSFVTASEGSATVTIIGKDTFKLLSCLAVSIWRSLYSGKFTQAQTLKILQMIA